ncbi:MAG: hypothetical protein JWN83_2585 [Chitinophagaceae bacterium]|nr:hypothetical protein [Chitinophagaceae bacterium]
MTPEEIKKKTIELRKSLSDFKKTGRITECFCHDKANCKGDIKQSHSIQRNGRLSIIEGDVNGNKVIYTFTETEFDESHYCKSLKPIGKGVASTFFGFCDYHDTTLFSPIENFPFDNSDKHCFLHSYRAFAHSYHRKKEELKANKTNSEYTKIIPKHVLASMIAGAEISVVEGEVVKAELDALLDAQQYDGLDYFTYVLPKKFPIACSSQISPYFSYKGTPMNNHLDPSIPYSHIMLTILPDNNQTIIILACFPDDEKGVLFLNELNNLSPLPLEKAISSILISCAENTFFAPALWDKLGVDGQRQLCDELERAASFEYVPTSFTHSKINFFDDRFSAARLGL